LALVKPQLVVPLLVCLVWQREWRALKGFALVAGVLAALSLPIAGPVVFADYPAVLLEDATEGGAAYRIMFSWAGFTARLIAEPPPAAVMLALNLATLAGMALAAAPRWQEDASRQPYALAALLCGALLISPHLYRPELVLLALVVAFGAEGSRQRLGTLGPWPLIGVVLWLAFIADIETGLLMATSVIIGMAAVVGYVALSNARTLRQVRSRTSAVAALERAAA
jgi:hypothetical protein